ncbi:MAG: FAD-binding oxidoreductase [Pseudomonadota bacterium]|nr:FAD-binding oxidoreductase [Pseudomonadota bacterium]
MPSRSAENLTAVVVGGGLIGMNCALALQARGASVTVVDRYSVRAASLGNAGHIAVEQVEPLASWSTIRSLPRQLFSRGGPVSLPPREMAAWLPFAIRFAAAARPKRFRAGKAALAAIAGAALPAWRRQLAIADASDLLIENGHFLVWETPPAAEEGRRRWSSADTGTVAITAAAPEELAEISAQLRKPLAGGLRFHGSAQMADLEELAQALATAFEGRGGSLVRNAAVSVRPHEVVLETGQTVAADAVIIAAGAASARLLRPLGYSVPLIAERGYHVQLQQTQWPTHLPPVVFEERAMILTRFRSGLRAAGFFEFARADAPPDPRKWDRLRTHLREVGLADTLPGTEWMGARPTLPDYLPAIGQACPGLFYAFGHQHLGLTLAAATSEAIAAMVGAIAPPFDLAPFAVERFAIRRS